MAADIDNLCFLNVTLKILFLRTAAVWMLGSSAKQFIECLRTYGTIQRIGKVFDHIVLTSFKWNSKKSKLDYVVGAMLEHDMRFPEILQKRARYMHNSSKHSYAMPLSIFIGFWRWPLFLQMCPTLWLLTASPTVSPYCFFRWYEEGHILMGR